MTPCWRSTSAITWSRMEDRDGISVSICRPGCGESARVRDNQPRVGSRDGAGALRPADRDRRVVPAPGGPQLAHARRRGVGVRGAAAGVRGVPGLAADAAAPRAALPPEARRGAAADRATAVG